MTPERFRQWRLHMGMSRTKCAARLGVGRNMPQKYEDGITPIPKYIELACAALAAGVLPWEPDDEDHTG